MVRSVIRVWMRCLLALVLALGAAAIPGDALAQKGKQTVAALIKKGQDFFDDQRYEESIQTLSAALLRPEIAKAEKLDVYKLLAFNYIVLDKPDEADGAVRGLLVTDEGFELPKSESPRFREFFEKSRKKWVEEGKPGLKPAGEDGGSKLPPVKIKHSSPAQVDKGSMVSLSGEIDDADGVVSAVRLYYRSSSTDKFKQLKVKYAVRKFSVEIPGAEVSPPLVEYYIEALDDKGIPLATRGDAETPLRIAVPEGTPVYKSPALWVPLSIVVVAAIVIPVVYFSTRTKSSTVTIHVTE
jgi:hypothetical protein